MSTRLGGNKNDMINLAAFEGEENDKAIFRDEVSLMFVIRIMERVTGKKFRPVDTQREGVWVFQAKE